MDTQQPRSHGTLAAAIIIVVVTGAGLIGSYYLRTNSAAVSTSTFTTTIQSTTAVTETITTTVPSNSSVIYSPVDGGLLLSAVIQPTAAPYGQIVTVVASVRDLLSTNIQVNGSALDNPVYGPCAQAFATGAHVYSGRYSSANVSQASQLLLYNPSLIYTCPAAFPQHYSFDPIKGVSETSLLTGYWTGSGQSYSFQKFPPGDYTVVVFDAWQQVAIGYFQVSSTSNGPVEIVSVTGPIPPYNPGGPVISITLKNIGETPVTSLNATLPFVNPRGVLMPYPFVFNVTSSNPLLPGQSIQETSTLIGASFDNSLDYPLTINGALLNGTQFSYTEQVQVVPPG